jgi:putative transposase
MSRTARVVLPDYPHHVIQRGHNRQTVFFEEGDYTHYLRNVREFKMLFGCKIYGYCLMPNHVHLIVDPCQEPDNMGRLMKRVAARQTRYMNKVRERTGTLWESRYKSSVIDTDRYLLACSRYVDLNPVRAAICEEPEEWRWSSCATKIGAGRVDWLDQDPCYMGMGNSRSERQAAYRTFLRDRIPKGEWEMIREAVQRGQLTGGESFVDRVESILGTRVEKRGRGRPRKTEDVGLL